MNSLSGRIRLSLQRFNSNFRETINLQTGRQKAGHQTRGSDMKRMIGLGGLAGLVLVGGSAGATTTTSTFGVTLAITAQCVINSTALLDFGSSGVINANKDTN